MSNICRLCLQSDSEKYYHMDTDDYRRKMQSVVPEINIQMVEEPFICVKCSELLIRAYSFKTNCLQTDGELKAYAKDDGNQIKLEEFLRQKNQDLSSDVQMETGESCVLDISSDEDQCEKKEKDSSYKIVYVDLVQKTNNFKQKINLDTDAIRVSETLIDKKNEEKPSCEKVVENSTIPQKKQKILVNKCPICNRIFLRKCFLDAHVRKHKHVKVAAKNIPRKLKQVVHQCHICNKVFLRKTGLEIHLKTYEHYKCSVCKMVRPCKATLLEHMRVHTGERPHQCKHCEKSFAQSSTLYTHIRSVHMPERPYICEICGMSFPVCGAYTAHKKRRHEPVYKNFVCNVCGKAYRIKSMLDTHMKWHTGERNYLCQVCNKRFVNKGSLTRHMRIHNGVKPFECPICQKTFTQNNNMKIHLKSCSRREINAEAK